MVNAQQLYMSEVLGLAPTEQLRLASLILDGLTKLPPVPIEYSDCWTEEDYRDASAASARYVSELYSEE